MPRDLHVAEVNQRDDEDGGNDVRESRIANLSASSVFLTTSISSGRGQSILACDDFVADRRRNRGKGKKESSMDFSATTEIRRRRRATSFIIDAWQNLIFRRNTAGIFSSIGRPMMAF